MSDLLPIRDDGATEWTFYFRNGESFMRGEHLIVRRVVVGGTPLATPRTKRE